LGRLRWDAQMVSWVAKVELTPGCPIRFRIECVSDGGDEDDEARIEVGAKYLAWARKAEPQVRKQIAYNLLDLYNRSWPMRIRKSGRPQMNRAEFLTNIQPSEIHLDLDGYACWDYSCGNLFDEGHVIQLVFGPDQQLREGPSLIEKYEEEDEDEEDDHRCPAMSQEFTCPTQGTGTVKRDQGVWHGVQEVKCPNCKGTGKVTKEK
jgi:hypothetical protein